MSSFFLKLLLLFFAIATLLLNINNVYEQQFSFLANSFLHGKLYFLEQPGVWLDSVLYKGHVYWPLGPAPAILLMPFVAVFNIFGMMFYQGYIQLILTFLIFCMAVWLAKKYKYSRQDSIWLAFAFCYASVYMMVALVSWGWYFVQAVTVAALFLSIVEWHTKKRYWLIGLCYAVIAASRFTAVFGLLFFIGDLILSRKKLGKERLVKNLLQLLIPVVIAGVGLLWYNYARFEDPLDNGYMTTNNWTIPAERRFEQINYGLFNIKNVPSNVYFYFIKTLDPVRVEHYGDFGQTFVLKPPYITIKYPGTSLFVASPIFLYVFFVLRRKKMNRVIALSLLVVIVVLLFLMPYYWTGWRQIGPRYTLDFLPFLYLILLHSFEKRRLTTTAKVLIACSAILNFYLFSVVAMTEP